MRRRGRLCLQRFQPGGQRCQRIPVAFIGCLLRRQFGADEAAINAWCATWIADGFDAIEALLARDTRRGDFCFGHAPTLADVYLVPQIESARRFGVDLNRWPLISAVDRACAALPAFAQAAPLAQPDAG